MPKFGQHFELGSRIVKLNLLGPYSPTPLKVNCRLKYSERQKYGINSLKIKHIFFLKKYLDRSILVYKNTYFNTT
jgi:hypothetical protein